MTTPVRRFNRRHPVFVGFLALLFWMTMVGYAIDVESCQRTRETRKTDKHNQKIEKAILERDATRALDYSKVDHNRAGAKINRRYSQDRKRRLASMEIPKVPTCFPIPDN